MSEGRPSVDVADRPSRRIRGESSPALGTTVAPASIPTDAVGMTRDGTARRGADIAREALRAAREASAAAAAQRAVRAAGAPRGRPHAAGAAAGPVPGRTTATRSRSGGWCPGCRSTAAGRPRLTDATVLGPLAAAGRGRRSPSTARRCRCATASWCCRPSPRRGPPSCAPLQRQLLARLAAARREGRGAPDPGGRPDRAQLAARPPARPRPRARATPTADATPGSARPYTWLRFTSGADAHSARR